MTMAAQSADTLSSPVSFHASPAAEARRSMIDSQLRVSGVSDEAVLAAFAHVPREDFVPAASRGHAYMDRAIALGGGRYLAAPLVHGRMLGEAAARPDDKVLLVDGGSGYLAALLADMGIAAEVIAPETAATAKAQRGDHTLLIIDGAIEHLPLGLVQNLADGARVITGLVSRGVTRLASGRKIAGEVVLMPLADIGMPILPEFAEPQGWSF